MSKIILGAGITGLALAWYLKKSRDPADKIILIEAQERAGSWIRTLHSAGFLCELGPHSCRSAGKGVETLELIEELGLADELITAAPSAQRRYLLHNGGLRQLPRSALSAIFSPITRSLPLALWRDWRCCPAANDDEADESIADFCLRHFGPALTSTIADAMVTGIFAGDLNTLSMRCCFPQIWQWAQEYGSVVRGALKEKSKNKNKSTAGSNSHSPFIENALKHSLFSLRSGMATLPAVLAKKLENELILGKKAIRIAFGDDNAAIHLADGTVLEAEEIYSTLSAPALAALLAESLPNIAEQLNAIPMASVATVSLGWEGAVLPYDGFGYLVPAKENEAILGAIWDSSVFPEQNATAKQTRITFMLGGMRQSAMAEACEELPQQYAADAAKRHLGIGAPADFSHVSYSRQAIPQYTVGYLSQIDSIRKAIAAHSPRLHFLGTAVGDGVGINDCIWQAKKESNSR